MYEDIRIAVSHIRIAVSDIRIAVPLNTKKAVERSVGHLEHKTCCLVVLPQKTQVLMWFPWQAWQFWQPGCDSVTHLLGSGPTALGARRDALGINRCKEGCTWN